MVADDEFDPKDLAEIEARFERVEFEETVTLCSYVELPYATAQFLIEQADDYIENQNWMAAVELLKFAITFIDTLSIAMEQGVAEDD